MDEDSGEAGDLGITWSTRDPEEKNFNGTFIVKVRLDSAGDDVSRFGVRSVQDTSNDYSLEIEYYSYYYTSGSGDNADVRWDN